MTMRGSSDWRSLSGFLLLVLLLAGCATTPGEPDPEANPDPLESINRPIHNFNMVTDRWVLRPVAKGYDWITPDPVQTGVGNFFNNLGEPLTVVNGLLQGELIDSTRSTGRFVLNSTVGILGLFDVADTLGLEHNRRDFGQTLGKWGLASGPYLVVPFIGPSTIRDGSGRVVDWFIDPYYLYYRDEVALRNYLLALDVVQTRASLLPLDRVLEQAFDPYAFLRDSYLQQRRAMIRNGDVEAEQDIFDEEYDDLDDLDDYEDL